MSPFVGDVAQVFYAPDPATDDWNEITDHVIFDRCSFVSNMAASPGQWEMTIRDMERDQEFVSGHEIRVDLNGTPRYGGYIWQVRKTYAFPADKTSGDVKNRLWILSGTDYNIIFDKRVLRNPAHYTKQIYSPGSSSGSIAIISPIFDGELIRDHLRFYFNLSGFDTEDTDTVIDTHEFEKGFPWPTQGTKLRQVMEAISTPDGTVGSDPINTWWVDAGRKFHFIPEHELAVEWGFSDVPDGVTTFGFREGSSSENAMSIVNDALVWGGSEWAAHGDIIFAREEDAVSQALHDRWQTAVVGVGSEELSTQALVDARALEIIEGPAGTLLGANMGLTLPERTFQAVWFNTRVPEVLVPGQVVPITLDVFGDDPVELPLRSLRMTFPELQPDDPDRGWTKFEGTFGLLQSDPAWLWRYLQKIRPGKIIKQVVATAKNDTSRPPYGAIYQDQPATQSIVDEEIVVTLDEPNGSKTLFHIPFMYVGNTMKVFVDGLAQFRGIDYTETDPAAGTFTFVAAPAGGAQILVWASVAGALV